MFAYSICAYNFSFITISYKRPYSNSVSGLSHVFDFDTVLPIINREYESLT